MSRVSVLLTAWGLLENTVNEPARDIGRERKWISLGHYNTTSECAESLRKRVALDAKGGGQVFLDGREITHLPMFLRARSGISYLPQEPSVFRKLTVEQNILAILETCKMSRAERKVRLKYLLDELDLAPLAKSKAYMLSGGEKRRLEITRALVTGPKLLLLDEPFAGIDPIAVYEVQKIVRRLRERGLGILITDHNVRETLGITDYAYILKDGRIEVEGTAAEIAASPVARKFYLGENFKL